MKKKAVFITNIPSPYRVDFFSYMQKNFPEYEFHIIFSGAGMENRKWSVEMEEIEHYHFLKSKTVIIRKRFDDRYVFIPVGVEKTLNEIAPDVVFAMEYNPTILRAVHWCRKKKIPFGVMADVCAPGLLIGQCIGRWGNFINREAFGRETEAFSRMGLTLPGRETVYVHPTFLYESLWNFVGFLLLHFWFRKHERKFDGELILLYAVWYGIGRALIEGLRTDSLYITGTGIRVSQLLAGVSAAAAAVVLALFYTGKLRHAPRYVDRGEQPNA